LKIKLEEEETRSLWNLEAPRFLWDSKVSLLCLQEHFLATENTVFILEWNGNFELQDYDSF